MTKVFTIVANEAIDLSTTECTLMQFSYNPEQIHDPESVLRGAIKDYLLHNAQNDVKKLEAIDEYLNEVYRKAEHSFKSKTGTSFNQTSLNVRLDAIAQYIENHFDECVEAAKGAIHISEV